MKILITGACSGIGFEVGKRLALKGHKIYLSVHTDSQYIHIKEKMKKYKNIKCMKLDITDKKDVKKLKSIDIDVLFSNAGIGYSGSILEIPIDKVRENFEVNVFSNLRVIQIIFKNMIKKGKGRLVIMSSLLGITPMKFLGVYSATKASIISMAITMKEELKLLNNNIKICLIEPGAYNTGFNQIMLNNKYDWMKKSSYFKKKINKIKREEKKLFSIIQKNNLLPLVKKIEDAILSNEPKFIYRAPLSQTIITKIKNLYNKINH